MTLTTGGTFATALFRGALVALGSGLFAALGTYAGTDEAKPIVLSFGFAFLAALGIRGGVEGAIDHARQEGGKVVESDVQAGESGTP
jgi:zinc transporter ZupT